MEGWLLDVVLALAVGAGLGLWFFGGLLWTVYRLPRARHPVVLALMSFAVRVAVVVAGLIWLVDRHWASLLAALVGFLAVRQRLVSAWSIPRTKVTAE